MYLRPSSIKILGFWLQNNVGAKSYIGAILSDGTPITFCTKEKWELNRDMNLKRGWDGDIKVFDSECEVASEYSEKVLRYQGLMEKSEHKLICPTELLDKLKSKGLIS